MHTRRVHIIQGGYKRAGASARASKEYQLRLLRVGGLPPLTTRRCFHSGANEFSTTGDRPTSSPAHFTTT
jgi:hypothetical protein